MNLPASPYPPTEAIVKTQAEVSKTDKDLVMTVWPDRGIYTLILQHEFKRIADFIRADNLEYINPDDRRRLLAYIVRGHADPCPVREADTRNDRGGTKGVRQPPPVVSDLTTDVQQGAKGGRRTKEGPKIKVLKDKHG